jgi:hypothetical protein
MTLSLPHINLPSRSAYWDDAFIHPSSSLLVPKAVEIDRKKSQEENVLEEVTEKGMGRMGEEMSQQQLAFLKKNQSDRKQKKAEKKKRNRVEKQESKRLLSKN